MEFEILIIFRDGRPWMVEPHFGVQMADYLGPKSSHIVRFKADWLLEGLATK